MADSWKDMTVSDVEARNAKVGWKNPAVRASDLPGKTGVTIISPGWQGDPPKKSKYRNVKTIVDGERFDSKREAQYWAELKLREKAGEIVNLKRQYPLCLCAPDWTNDNGPSDKSVVIAHYIADFAYEVPGDIYRHFVDVKGGKETAMFALKRKWIYLQSGIEIEVIR